jgi:chorismate mutase
MNSIQRLRSQIDDIDDKILLVLYERVKICKAIGLEKKTQNMPIKDSCRENEVYIRIREKAAQLDLDLDQIKAVFREIVNMCSAVQE